MIQVYTGDGKGKTTAALGLALRAAGAGKRVAIIQFCKKGGCAEHVSLKKLGILCDTGYAIELPPWDTQGKEQWRAHARVQYNKAADALKGGYDVVILDEFMAALHLDAFPRADAETLLDILGKDTEVILTGRAAPKWLIARADLVTRMECVKHYFTSGIAAREGIEF